MGIDASRLRPGMYVPNPDGHRIGKVVAVEGDCLRVRQGLILPDEFCVSLADITRIEGDDLAVEMRGTIPGEFNQGRNSGSRGLDVAERTGDDRLL